MYESQPTQREGEPIRQLVPEAIEATGNMADERYAGHPAHLQPNASTVRLLAALVIIEAMVIVALLAGWVIF